MKTSAGKPRLSLTKAQWRVIEFLHQGVAIKQLGTEWMPGNLGEHKRFSDKTVCVLDLIGLAEPFPRSMCGISGNRVLRLTDRGKALAAARFRGEG